MKKIDKPIFTAKETFEVCISTITQPPDLKPRFESITDSIEKKATEFESKFLPANLFQIQQHNTVDGIVSGDEMKKLYTEKLVGGPGRDIYNALLAAAPIGGKCALCGVSKATTLDHQLAKSTHPSLAVTPLNLVPACRQCNNPEKKKFPTQGNEQLLSPYFDDAEGERWLKAKVIRQATYTREPAPIVFSADPPNNWVLAQRVIHHFREMKLAETFSALAVDELLDIRHDLNRIFKSKQNHLDVARHLRDQANSRLQNRKNSWRTALYFGICSDQWFCSGGFGLI